ncbi:MAG: hypothetical protein OXU61_06940 [Gammaproteobacteria bacterium]|nr:hypothetical protein [Gammaproteobacteria bacterium]
MSEIPFLIWETPDPKRAERNYGKNVWYVHSPRAGGYYAIDADVADDYDVIRREPELARESLIDNKVKLSRWIYEENLHLPRTVYDKDRDLLPFIDEKAISRIEQQRISSVPDRIDALLRHIEYKTIGRIAMKVRLPNEEQAMAATSSSSYEELEYLACEAERINWLNGVINTIDTDASITLKGHMRLEELRSKQVLSEQAFVAMWFSKEMKPAWEQGFKPGIEAAGYKPMRIDQKQHINKIDDEIIAEIRRSRFLVADFTAEPEKPRGGVYYEAGFAHGLNIPVIFTCRADYIDDLHFDTRQFNHIAWKEENLGDLRKQLKNRISATIGDGPRPQKPQAAAKSQSGN